MTLLPIVERELRVRARQRATFWVRFGAALGGVVICFLVAPRYIGVADSADLGPALFGSLVLTAYLTCCVAFVLTADVISSERREKTLGLLFLTRIKSLDVLLGKMVSASVTSVSALAGFLPILMLPVLAGGVTGGEAARSGLVIVNQLLAGIAAGVWASSRGSDWFANTAKALAITLALVPLSAEALSLADDKSYSRAEAIFWSLTVLQHVATWLLFLSAWSRLKRSLQAEERALAIEHAIAGPRIWPGMTQTQTVRRRRKPLADDLNPIEWYVRHERGVRSAFWGAAILLFVRNVVLLVMDEVGRFGGGTSSYWSGWVFLLTFELFAVALQAWAATRFFLATRHTGELEVLMSTPLGAGDVITGQWRGLRRRLRIPVFVALMPIMLHAAAALGWAIVDWRRGFNWSVVALDAGRIAESWFSVVAVCWVGMWFALKASRPAAAVARTVIMVEGIPLVFALLLPAFVGFFAGAWSDPNLQFGSSIQPFGYALLRVSFWLPILWPVLLVLWARKRLQSDLRGVAGVRFGVRSDWSEIREALNRWRRGSDQLSSA